MDNKKLNDLIDHFKQRKAYARERLDKLDGKRETCFALSGFAFQRDSYELSGIAVLRKVHQAPGEIELAGALYDKALLSPIARHMPSVTFELAVDSRDERLGQAALNMGWYIISALRCRSLADFLVPAVSSVSWDAIPAIEDASCYAQLIEDVPRARQLRKLDVCPEAVDWVETHILKWAELLNHPAFHLAVDSLTTHHQHANLRMSAAALWAGFEALFGVSSELRFRLALLAAAYIEERGPERLSLYRRIKKLYDYRSKAVHGGVTTDELLVEHIVEVRGVLSRLMCRMTEEGKVPTVEEFEEHLLS